VKDTIHFGKITILGRGNLSKTIQSTAIKLKLADNIALSKEESELEHEIRESDLVIIDQPVVNTLALLPKISDAVKPGTIVTDTAGIKKRIVDQAQGFFSDNRYFVGSHPMIEPANGEKKEDLSLSLSGATAFVTVAPETNRDAVCKIALFWKALGMVPLLMNPERHDRYMALLIHLPYAAACSLGQLLSRVSDDINFIRQMAGKSLREGIHAAGLEASLGSVVLFENAPYILAAIDHFSEALGKIRKAIEQQDLKKLESVLKDSEIMRRNLET